ncbi:MAG: hypothetical protein JWQ73_3677 [Variovorax sp.]|nr:hypothetical protein [Variovorax sp.]
MQRPTVLLACWLDWAGTARLPEAFAQAGFGVAVCAPEGHRATLSGFVDETTLVPQPVSIDGYLQSLRHCIDQGQFAYCMVCDDDLLFILADRRAEPWVQRLLPTPATEACLDFVISKLVFPAACERIGLPVPATSVHVDPEALRVAASALGFPLMAKLARGSGGRQVFLLDDAGALDRLSTQLPHGTPLALQAHVAGTPGACCALWVRGELKAWFSFHSVSTWPNAFGPSSVVRLVDRPQLEPLLRTVGEVSRFHGLGGIDFIERPDGSVVLTEQHGRPVPQFVLAAEAGIDLPRALQALVHDDVHAPLQRPASGLSRGPSRGEALPLFPQEAERMIRSGHSPNLRRWRHDPLYRAQLGRADRPVFAATMRHLRRLCDANRDGIVPVDACYLAMHRGAARQEAMQAQLKALGMAWVRRLMVPASLSLAGQRGFAEHLGAIERAAPEAVTLILDAGARISPLLPGLLRNPAMLALRQYDVILLECQPVLTTDNLAKLWHARQRHTDGVDVLDARGLYSEGAAGYMVTPGGRRTLLPLLRASPAQPFDVVLRRLIDERQIRAAVLVPFLVNLQFTAPGENQNIAALRTLFFADAESGPRPGDLQRLDALTNRADESHRWHGSVDSGPTAP